MANNTRNKFGSQAPDIKNIDAAGVSWSKELDWIEVGGGVGGLTSAITVHKPGLQTLQTFNKDCLSHKDTELKRGDSAYDNYFGDVSIPNPNLATIEKAPFYAVTLFPGGIGTQGGLVTNEHAQVFSNEGDSVEGLYVTGNTIASVMGRSYPGAGSTIGPSMTFAYVAAMHAAR